MKVTDSVNTKEKKKRSIKRKVLIITGIVLFTLLVILPCAAIAVIKWLILPPERLTPLVLEQVDPLVNGRIKCARMELTFWETFPKVGLRLTDGEIISYSLKDSVSLANGDAAASDSLLSFSRAMVSVDIMDYFRHNRITVERVFIDNPVFYGVVDEEGRTNWDIFPSESDQEEVADTTEANIPIIDLQRIRVRNANVTYHDCTADLYTHVEGFNLKMRNSLTKGNLNVEVETGFESLLFDSPAYTLENELSLRFASKIDMSRGKISFTEASLSLNNLPFTAAGELLRSGDNLGMDIDFTMNASNLAELVAFVPDEYFQNRKKITTKGSVAVEGKINGLLGDSVSPNVSLSCVIANGMLKSKGSKHGIEKLDTDLDVHLNGNHPDSSFVIIRKLAVEGTNTSFSARGKVNKVLTDPYIDGKLKGKIDFTGMMQDILNPDSLVIKGTLNADIEAAFRVEELADGNFSRLKAAGRFTVDRLLYADRIAGLSLFMRGVDFKADTTTQQSGYLTDDDLISAFLKVDSMNMRYQQQINTRIKGLDVQVKTSRSFDTSAVVPLTTHIKMENIRARMPDSVWVVADNLYLRGGLKASDTDKKKGVFAGSVTVDTLRYFDVPSKTRMLMAKSTFNLQMLPMRDARRQRRQAEGATAADSTRRTRQRNSGQNQSQVDSGDVSQTKGLLRNWEVKGSVKFDAMRLFTGIFPLPMRMEQTTLRFDTDKITLTNAKMRLGKSDFLLDGEINSIRRAILRGGVLQGRLSLTSDYIDCNQLMNAINRSGLLAEDQPQTSTQTSTQTEESIVENWENDSDAQGDALLAEDLEDGLFVVPANIDLALRTKAKKVDFQDVTLQDINGMVVVRNQSLNLRRLKLNSEIGSGNLTMIYTAKDRQKATAGFELEMDDIIVERLISMFPSIDTLLPMLRSFEGVVDCQMTATCDIDSAMNVILPSLNAACYLSGENMVLMDGETFAEISKTLMFKNKKRNLIDYISVDLSVKDNKIEIFPFMVDIDRYKLAVGGVHNLDMTFDYHVSVLKSPVPFKLGIDIKGDLDDFKYKVVKCRYKNIFTPAREQELEDTRLNLRAEVRESIRKQLQVNAPELASEYGTRERVRSRRPEEVFEAKDDETAEESASQENSDTGENSGQVEGRNEEEPVEIPAQIQQNDESGREETP